MNGHGNADRETYCPHCGARLTGDDSTYLAVWYFSGTKEFRCAACNGRVELPDCESCQNRVDLMDNRPHCPHCNAVLDTDGSVAYAETDYPAHIETISGRSTVVYVEYDYKPTAYCRACGGDLEFDDVMAI